MGVGALLELGLATWRLSYMLVREAGPMDVMVKLRVRSGIEYGNDGKVVSYPPWNPLHCTLCTSVYVGLLLVVMPVWVRRALAASGMASLAALVLEG